MTTPRPRTPRAWISFWLKSRMSSLRSAHWPSCLAASLSTAGSRCCNYSLVPRQRGNRSGGEADLTGGRQVITGELRRSLLQPSLPKEPDQRLYRRTEIAALPHQQIEILEEQRDKIEPRRFCRGAGRYAAVGLAGADPRGKIGPGETKLLEPAPRLRSGAGARQH